MILARLVQAPGGLPPGARPLRGSSGEELAAYGAAGEFGAVQVGVERGRVGADLADHGRVDPGGGAGDREHVAGNGRGEQRDDDRAVDAERALVDVAEGRGDAEPGEGVADPVPLRPDER